MAWKGGGAGSCGSGRAAWSRVTANIPADSRGNEKYIYQMPGSREGKGYFIRRFYICSDNVSEGIEKNRCGVPSGLAALFSGIRADLGVLPALRSAFFHVLCRLLRVSQPVCE